MEVNPLQPENAPAPIFLTLLGMVIEVKLSQPLNAFSPILIILSGMIVVEQPAISVLLFVSIIALQFSRLS